MPAEHHARVGHTGVTAGDDDLARAHQLGLAQAARRVHLVQQRMAGRHHGHQRLVADLAKALAPIEPGPLEHQRQLGAAGVQHGQRIGLRRDQHFHVQQRMFGRQLRQRRGPARRQQLRGDGQGEAIFQPLRQRQRVSLQFAQLQRQLARLRLQRAGGGRGLRFAPAAVEELQVQLGLQVGDRHADGRGHAPQRARGSREGAVVEHGQEQQHVVGAECHDRQYVRKTDMR